MLPSLFIGAATCLLMIGCILFFPSVRIRRFTLPTYPFVAFSGALLLILTGQTDFPSVGRELVSDSAINPIKILILFLSMTILSIYLDELGFFAYLADKALGLAGHSQRRLFFYLYVTVSVLTVFTSNDIIILSFTPFICYFAKNAKIDPIPYLAAEFVAANTWSMALIIGNPTNIYLATSFGADFLTYAKTMLLPTLCSGTVAFFMLYLLFFRKLKKPMEAEAAGAVIRDKARLTVGIVHLGICTVALAISSYVGFEMWQIALASVISLFLWIAGISFAQKKKPTALFQCLKRAPWELIPFVISMFVIIIVWKNKGITNSLAAFLGEKDTVFRYGISSFLSANLINNIPMSVLFSEVSATLPAAVASKAVFASIVGSNIGAFMTPIGALAGIMFSSLLGDRGIHFGYRDFLKLGVTVAIPALLTALGVLALIL